jgi:GT2 family glycosyltransferase
LLEKLIHRNIDNRVSIIVVNWNGARFLKPCLSALSNQTYDDCEIILVDNGSGDGSVSLVKENFPAVKVVELAENLGFTGGNAAGLKVAKGEFIALVNNDALPERNWLEKLLQPMLTDPNIGICASELIIEGTKIIDSAGNGITTGAVGFNRGLGTDMQDFSISELVFGACGAAALYRRSMLTEIGFFDDEFFLYDEDIDLSFRAQLAGWKCRYVPDAVAHHKGNATSERLSDLHIYYHTRNLEFVWIKNMPGGLVLRFLHHKLIQELSAFAYLCLRHGKWKPFLRAKKDAIRMLPNMLKKRRDVQCHRRVSNRYVKQILTPIFDRQYLTRKASQIIHG